MTEDEVTLASMHLLARDMGIRSSRLSVLRKEWEPEGAALGEEPARVAEEERRNVNDTTRAEEANEWKTPYCANEAAELKCPSCEGPVCVREHETYYDGHDYEAFCGDCHAELTVYASVEVKFGDVEQVSPKESDAGGERR